MTPVIKRPLESQAESFSILEEGRTAGSGFVKQFVFAGASTLDDDCVGGMNAKPLSVAATNWTSLRLVRGIRLDRTYTVNMLA